MEQHGGMHPTLGATFTPRAPSTEPHHHVDLGQPPAPDILTTTTNLGTSHNSDQTPPTTKTSAAITQLLDDLALRRPPHAPLTDAEREQMQAEQDKVLRGDFPRNATLTEHLPHDAMPPPLDHPSSTSVARTSGRTVTFDISEKGHIDAAHPPDPDVPTPTADYAELASHPTLLTLPM